LTLRIERTSGRRRTRIRLSGEFRAGHIDQVKAELRSARQPVALDEGESIEALGKQGAPPAGAAAVRPDDHGFLWIDKHAFGKAFADDVDPTEAAVMAAVQKPLSVNSFATKSGPPAWKHIPSWYMVATDDQMIPPPAEEFMAKRIGATVKKVAASHAAIVSHPKEVADLITLAVESVGKSVNTRVSR